MSEQNENNITTSTADPVMLQPVPQDVTLIPPTSADIPQGDALRLRSWLGPLLFFCIIGIAVYSVRVAAVTGGSMEPTLHEGTSVIIDKLTPRFIGVGRGDMIVFNNPKDASVTEVKRVVGLPGELVLIEGGTISVTPPGGRITEFSRGTYIGGDGKIGDFRLQLGPQEYFVLGDNRGASTDSRDFGAVYPGDIIGKVVFSF